MTERPPAADAEAQAAEAAAGRPAPVPFGTALRFWFKLGLISFGGPAGQIAIMHAELVERRRWIGERRFLHALNYCMLLPGPEAQQLATYLGWLLHRTWGGIAAGALFVLPSLLLLIALSWVYVAHGDVPWIAGIFYGIKPAVVAIVFHAAWRIGSRVLHNRVLWAIAVAAFVAIFVLRAPFPLIVAAAALAGWLGARWAPRWFEPGNGGHAGSARSYGPALIDDDTPRAPHTVYRRRRLATIVAVGLALWALPMALLLAWQGAGGIYTQMGAFFTSAALVTFGGAYAVLPYVYQGAVLHFGWLSPTQMIDGLALGEATPGPLIMVVAFVAFVGAWQSPELLAQFGPQQMFAAAALAAVLVTWVTFLPSFVFILAGGPLIEGTRGRLGYTAPLTAITAAVVGVIVNLALFFAYHVLWPQGFGGDFDLFAAVLAAAALLALARYKRGVIETLAVCAAAGLAWTLLR
jgi:chromate transporter